MLHSHPSYQLQDTCYIAPPKILNKSEHFTSSTKKLWYLYNVVFFVFVFLYFILYAGLCDGQSVPVQGAVLELQRGHTPLRWKWLCNLLLLPFILFDCSMEVYINIKKMFFRKREGGGGGASGGVTNSLCKLLGHFRKLNLAATPLPISLVPTRRFLSARIIKICCWDALNVIVKHQLVLGLIVVVPQS